MNTFDKKRLLSLIEYNMKKYRIGGIEYRSKYCTNDPTGVKGLITNDKYLSKWQQKPYEIKIGVNDTKYTLKENNLMMRDFLAQTIIDVFSGNESKGNYTKSNQRLYNLKPSNSSNIENKEKPFIIKRGNNEVKICEDGVFINGKKWETLWDKIINLINKYIKSSKDS